MNSLDTELCQLLGILGLLLLLLLELPDGVAVVELAKETLLAPKLQP